MSATFKCPQKPSCRIPSSAIKEMEAAEAKGQKEAAEKREEDLKRSLSEKGAVEDNSSKQLAEVRIEGYRGRRGGDKESAA